MTADEIMAMRRNKENKAKFNYRTVPCVIQFAAAKTRESLDRRLASMPEYYFFTPFNCILTERRYRMRMTVEEAERIARITRGISQGTAIEVLFVGHPTRFFKRVAQAYVEAYRTHKQRDIKNVENVLAMVDKYDTRAGMRHGECPWCM